MNQAQQIINECDENEGLTKEDFQNWLYPDNISGSCENLISKKKPLFKSSQLPEVSFKFNYKHENKDPLEELGIEVLK